MIAQAGAGVSSSVVALEERKPRSDVVRRSFAVALA